MKKIPLILFFFGCLVANGQQLNQDQWHNQLYPSPIWFGWSEYLMEFGRTSDSTWWVAGNDITLRGLGSGTAPQAIPSETSLGGTVKFVQFASSLHDDMAVSAMSDTSFGYEIGSNAYGQRGDGTTNTQTTPYKLRLDSAGNLFDSLYMIAGIFYPTLGGEQTGYAAVKNNGSVWAWGYLANGGAGNQSTGGTLKKPIHITLSGGKIAEYITCTDHCAVLCSDSTVQTWGNDNCLSADLGRSTAGNANRSPADIGLAHIVSICMGYGINYAIDRNGDLWEWGAYAKLYGGQNFTTGVGALNVPTKVTSILGLPATIKKIVVDHNTTLSLLTNGQLWSWGGVPTGANGVGQDFNWPAYTGLSGTTPYNGPTPAPWNWSLEYFNFSGDYVDYVVATPQQVMPGKNNFCQIFGGQLYTFNLSMVDSTGQIFEDGRGKACLMQNGVLPADTSATQIQAAYHVSWDQIYPILVHPWTINTYAQVTSPYCVLHPSGSPCSNYTIPTRTAPHASVTSYTHAPGQIVLDGTASTAHFFVYKLWKQLTGPATAQMQVQTSPTDTMILNTPGTYTFQYKITDDVWQSDSAVATIIIASTPQTAFYFKVGGLSTTCTGPSTANACPPSLFNSTYATEIAGDTNYLNRGDVFQIEMVANVSGSIGGPIVTRPYGTGNLPIIGGRTALTGWTNVSGNVWQVTYTGPQPNILQHGDTILTQTTYPDLVNGWLTPTSMTTTTITDAAHAGMVTIGSKIMIRSSQFTIDTAIVSNVSGGVITFAPATYSGTGGHGWKVMNITPYENGQYQDTLGQIRIYSVGTPTGNWTIPTVDTPLLSEGTYQEWDSLRFQGGNNADILLAFQATGHNVFNADSITDAFDGFSLRTEGNLTVKNCVLRHFTDNGVWKTNNNNYNNTFINDIVYDAGMHPGLGRPGANQGYSGIIAGDSGSLVLNCTVDSIGYIGIANYGSGFASDSNLIYNFCQTLEDGGGHYTYQTAGSWARQRQEINNIIFNGGNQTSNLGCSLNHLVAGSYTDNFSQQILIQGNGIANVDYGFYDHGPTISYLNNVVLNARSAQMFLGQVTGGPTISGVIAKGNVFGYTSPVAPGAYSVQLFSVSNNLNTFCSTCDTNFYLVPWAVTNGLFTQSSTDIGTNRTLASWTSNTGYDAHTQYLNYSPLIFVYSINGNPQSLYGIYGDVYKNQFNGTITVGAYLSTILERLSLPAINIGVGQKISVH